jgi:hypothetical protein
VIEGLKKQAKAESARNIQLEQKLQSAKVSSSVVYSKRTPEEAVEDEARVELKQKLFG